MVEVVVVVVVATPTDGGAGGVASDADAAVAAVAPINPRPAAITAAARCCAVALAKFFCKINFLDEMMSLLSLPRDYRLSRVERGRP